MCSSVLPLWGSSLINPSAMHMRINIWAPKRNVLGNIAQYKKHDLRLLRASLHFEGSSPFVDINRAIARIATEQVASYPWLLTADGSKTVSSPSWQGSARRSIEFQKLGIQHELLHQVLKFKCGIPQLCRPDLCSIAVLFPLA
nr:hypothetical protein Iba_chr14eCG9860 [Ipomoea batatas]